MDLADIHRQAQAAREFTECIDGATFTLRIPTRLDSRVALARVQAAHPGEQADMVLALLVERQSLVQAIAGWSGVPLGWVLRDAEPADQPCAFEPGMVGLLLDERPSVTEQLGRALFERMRAYNDQRDTAAKN